MGSGLAAEAAGRIRRQGGAGSGGSVSPLRRRDPRRAGVLSLRAAQRFNRRNGYRARSWDTRQAASWWTSQAARRVDFPDWLLVRHRCAEAALATLVALSCLFRSSVARMERLVETSGTTRCPSPGCRDGQVDG